MSIKLISHNINGFDRNADFVRDLCSPLPSCIYGLQEHWLRPPYKNYPGVNKLKTLHPELDGWGVSAMKDKITTKILSGRPFGGTGFVWTKSLAVKPRCEYSHERVSVVEINSNLGNIILINCYMPYFNNNDITSQLNLYVDALAFVDSVIKDNPDSKFIIMGDMNCNIYSGNNQFASVLNDFITDRKLTCTYDLKQDFDYSSSFTRSNLKLNSYSLLDYVFVSESLVPYVTSVNILDSVSNLSDHLPVAVDLSLDIVTFKPENVTLPMLIDWKSIDDETRSRYESVMDECLNNLNIPNFLHGPQSCNDSSHIIAIERYYSDLIECIKTADLQLPRCKPTMRKCYWNEQLSSLKNDSIVAYDYWKINNCPKSGPIFEMKKNAHYRYKLYLRECQKTRDRSRNDLLNEDLINGDHHKFWKSYKYFNCSRAGSSAYVNGYTRNIDIANCFADSFKSVYETCDVSQSQKLRDEFHQLYANYSDVHCNDSLNPYLLSWSEMINVVSKLKMGKGSASFMKAEHILFGSPRLIVHLHILFNAFIQHAYVPQDFLNGVITPLIKDSEGDHSSVGNYRGLTLGVVFSFLFEHALLMKIGHLLSTDSLQFGYKKRHSCSHAIFTLQSCVEYFNNRGSSVYAAFLDCTKGFDKINHDGLFIKLINRKVPLCILNLIIYWYSNLTSIVKWNGVFSRAFSVGSGVRQGGVLSPHLFAIYLDDLISILRKLKIGCHILDVFISAIAYADDICLLAPCRSALQTLLDACENYGKLWCLSYNPSKSKTMFFGRQRSAVPFKMYGSNLDYVESYKYLGVDVVAGESLTFSTAKPLMKFRCSANTVLNARFKPSERVLMKILFTVCVPNLTYAGETLNYSSRQIGPLDVALNDCIRKIFSYQRWESVRFLRASYGYPSLTEIFHGLSTKFLERIPCLKNDTLSFLYGLRTT